MPSEWPAVSKGALWTARVISRLIALCLFFDPVLKFVKAAPVIDGFAHLGIPIHVDDLIGITLLICVLLYALLPTTILRGPSPLPAISDFSQVPFATCSGALRWWRLCILDPRLDALVSLRS
jgi:hypothetical protein